MNYNYLLSELLDIQHMILKDCNYEKSEAEKRIGYKKLDELVTTVTNVIKEEEVKEILENSFLLLL